MASEETTYEILDGVRRAKAASLCGNETVQAQVNGIGPVIDVAVQALLSPKDEINTTGVRGQDWWRVLRATQSGVVLPPIEITPGAFGIPIADVAVEEDEIDALRKSLE